MQGVSKLHTQEYRDIELNIVVDEIGPGEGLLDSGGIEIPLKPAGKGGVAQFPAGSPAQATACGRKSHFPERKIQSMERKLAWRELQTAARIQAGDGGSPSR